MKKIVPLLLMPAFISSLVYAQTKSINKDEIKVFVDCNARCDMSFIKTEINYVDFVPDRFLANVYIMLTSQSTGSGGEEIKLFFGGQDNFKGMEDTLQLYRTSVDTDDEYRKRLVHFLKLGLTRYIAKTSLAQKLDVTVVIEKNQVPVNSLSNKKDKWNFWVYNVGLSGNYNSDDFSKSNRITGRLSANRVTEKLKVNLSANISTNQRSISFQGNETKFTNNSSGINSTIVKSITPHWSAGGYGSFFHSTYSNYAAQYTLNPAIEYSFFPYKEAVKKSVTIFYQAGPSYNNYIDSGYYDTPEHVVFNQQLSVNIGFTQKWGTFSLNTSWDNFFNTFSLSGSKIKGSNVNTFSIGGNLEVRIVKGLSFNMYSYANFTKGIYPNIPRNLFSRDDLLTNTRQYPTQKVLFMYFGINYRFGSIYNNVVNPRFDKGGNMNFFF